MAGLPRLPWLPQERAAKVRLSRVQRDRHDVPRLLVETAEGVEALLDFLMKSKQASRLTQGTRKGDSCGERKTAPRGRGGLAWLSEKLGASIIAGPGFDASRNCNGTRISGTESRVSVPCSERRHVL